MTLFIALMFVDSPSASSSCIATDDCQVDVGANGFEPEAPKLIDVIPRECHGRILQELSFDNAIANVPTGWTTGWDKKMLNLENNSLKNIETGTFENNGPFWKGYFFIVTTHLVSMAYVKTCFKDWSVLYPG